MADGTRMQQRRATEAVWTTANYVLAAGEIGVTTDTGIIKIGDGVTTWTDLDPAFSSQYLPLLGKAADSDLLDGINSSSFVKFTDTTTAATADKVALRLSDGRLKATTATASDDLTTKAQMDTALVDNKLVPVSRTVTAAATLALTDLNKMIFVNNSSLTTQVVITVPTNATVAFAIGAWVDVIASGIGGAKFSPASGVTISGSNNIFPPYGSIRLIKTGTDTWVGITRNAGKRLPKFRVLKNTGGTSYPNGSYTFVPYDTIDTVDVYNPDNEWFSIPGTGLATARRVILNKDGEYIVHVQFNSSSASVGFTTISLMVADNTITGGSILNLTPGMGGVTNAFLRTRFTAGQSVGVGHNPAVAGMTDLANGASSIPHWMSITRLSD